MSTSLLIPLGAKINLTACFRGISWGDFGESFAWELAGYSPVGSIATLAGKISSIVGASKGGISSIYDLAWSVYDVALLFVPGLTWAKVVVSATKLFPLF